MQLSIEKEKLNKYVSLVEVFADPKPSIPILSHLRLEARAGELAFSASNTETSVHLRVLHDGILAEGTVTLPAKKFSDIVRLLPEGRVELRSLENNQVQVASRVAKSTAKLLALNPEDFPTLPDCPEESFELPIRLLLEAERMAGFCIAETVEKYALNCLFLEIAPSGTLRAVASDGHRLSYYEADIKAPIAENRSVLIPGKALSAVARVFSALKVDAANVSLSWTDHHVFFSLPGLTITARRVSGQFPDYQRLIQNANPHHFQISTTELREAIRRVAVMSEAKSQGIRWSLAANANQMVVSAESTDFGAAREAVSIESYTGPEMNLGLNAQYVLEFLETQPSSKVQVFINDPETQLHMQPVMNGKNGNARFRRLTYTLAPMQS
jgi:DNA polymerase-3 subunit beta